jgi:hypothetical protein
VPGVRLHWEDIKALNKSVQTDPKRPLHEIPEEYGGGYIGMLEVFHLLHCLDEVRKATYPEYYAAEWEAHGGVHAARVHNGKPQIREESGKTEWANLTWRRQIIA